MMEFKTEKLIELVRAYECIYDKRHIHHRNRNVIDNIWKNIASEMNVEGKVCKEKWSNLRSNYNRELRKLREKPSGSVATSTTTWPYMEQMSFLRPYFLPRLQSGNIIFDNEGGEMEAVSQAVLEDGEQEREELSFSETSQVLEPSEVSPVPASSLIKRNRKFINQYDIDLRYLSELKKMRECQEKSNIDIDDDTHFLLSLKPSMQKLSPPDNLFFRIEVQQLLRKLLYPATSSDIQTSPPTSTSSHN